MAAKTPASSQQRVCCLDRIPAQEVMGQHASLGAGAHQPTQAVEDCAHIVAPLGRIRAEQRQIRARRSAIPRR
jgi:hypothetical protein